MFTVILLSLIGCDNSMLDSAAMASCEDGVDDDGDGFVDLEDPDCFEDGSGEEMDYQGPVEGLELSAFVDLADQTHITYTWTASGGWASGFTLTMDLEDSTGASWHEEHFWADPSQPLVLEIVDTMGPGYDPGVSTQIGYSDNDWTFCALHVDGDVCISGTRYPGQL